MRKHYNFTGAYAPYIEQLIALKQKLGYKYTSAQELLFRFDLFTIERAEPSPGITKELSDAWSQRIGFESEKYRQSRVRILIQLSSLMNDIGVHSYIPVFPKVHERRLLPYLRLVMKCK